MPEHPPDPAEPAEPDPGRHRDEPAATGPDPHGGADPLDGSDPLDGPDPIDGPDPRRRRRRRSGMAVPLLLTVTAVIGVVVFGAVVVTRRAPSDRDLHGVLLSPGTVRPDLTLVDTDGEPYDFRERTAGKLTLLYFGYTTCPDACPITMASIARALERTQVDATVVFVTTDPARDTPARLRTWLDQFRPGMVGLTGTPEQLAAMQQAAGVAPASVGSSLPDSGVAGDPGAGYEVIHASQVLVFTADDTAHVAYSFGVSIDDWVADLPVLAARGAGS